MNGFDLILYVLALAGFLIAAFGTWKQIPPMVAYGWLALAAMALAAIN